MAEFSRAILKVVVAQICQTIGWHSVNSTPLEFMIDLMQEYLLRISRLSNQYTEILGRTEVNLDDVGLALQHMNIDIHQLAEYVKNVDSIPCAISVPKIPQPRENHLNFLKPGSREVVTRPVHVHEHLPAMYSEIEEPVAMETDALASEAIAMDHQDIGSAESQLNSSPNQLAESVFKRPGDPLPENAIAKRAKMIDEGRPLREIHSVMMTTSGFLSPAREGKLPEPRTPVQSRTESPSPGSYPMVPPELKTEKKAKKVVKKAPEERKFDKENKKKNREKELFKPDKISESKVKKLVGMKELAKLKPLKPVAGKLSGVPPSSASPSPSQHPIFKEESPKIPKTLSPKLKPDKAINASSVISVGEVKSSVGKLSVEPDKQKLNIFKKISKPRDEKPLDFSDFHRPKDLTSRESSPGLVIDEVDEFKRNMEMRTDIHIKREDIKPPHTPEIHTAMDAESRSPSSEVYMFDDMSPPGTPSTPKTPELNVPGLSGEQQLQQQQQQKKKKKDKSSRKKDLSKALNLDESPIKVRGMTDSAEMLGRPKTPEALEMTAPKDMNLNQPLPFPFFPSFPSAPGLIPHPIGHPMFPRFPHPLVRPPMQSTMLHGLAMPPRFMPPPPKVEEPLNTKVKLERDMAYPPVNMKDVYKNDVEKVGKSGKIAKQEEMNKMNLLLAHVSESPLTRYESFALDNNPGVSTTQKLDKAEKMDKKSKKHKIERKEKLKKKKEKKDKHKEKLEKVKEKKEKIEKIKEKKERKEKRKDKEKEEKSAEVLPKITLKLATGSPRPPTPESSMMKKITIKPLLKKSEDSVKREFSPELAKISALVTRPPKQKATKPKPETSKKHEIKEEIIEKPFIEPVVTTIDQSGHQVWICPGCGKQDDGSPMIGCDDCDAWYHWVCVGMQVPPAANEDWYCRNCILKKQELHHDKKKKKRKKKVKIVA